MDNENKKGGKRKYGGEAIAGCDSMKLRNVLSYGHARWCNQANSLSESIACRSSLRHVAARSSALSGWHDGSVGNFSCRLRVLSRLECLGNAVVFQIFGNGANAIAMFPGVFIPEVANFGNNRVFAHGNSSSVHITGNGKSEASTIFSMVLRVLALAICVQFQVIR